MAKRYTGILLAFFAILLLWELGALNVSIMEARNFVTAREMIEDGSYLIPTLNGEYRLQKPPLPTWLTALSGSFSDMKSVFWLRFPAVLLGLLAIAYTMKIASKISSNKHDIGLTGAMLVTSFYMFLTARSGMWDIFVQGFMLAGVYYYILFARERTGSLSNSLIFGTLLAASFMSKGPVALYGLLLPFLLAFHVIYRRDINWSKKKGYHLLAGIILAIVLSSLWPLYINFSEAGYAASKIVATESQNWVNYNVRPIYYYWSFPSQTGIWTVYGFVGVLIFGLLYKKLKPSKSIQLYFWWTIFVIVLLSIIPEKKSRYLFPVLFPIILFLSELVQSKEKNLIRKSMKIAGGLTCLVLSVIGILLLFNLRPELGELSLRVPGGLLILLISLGALYELVKDRFIRATYLISGVVMVFIFFFARGAGDLMNSTSAVNSFHRFTSESQLISIPLYSTGDLRPELVWQIERKAPVLWDCTLPVEHPLIGVFSYYGIEQEMGNELDGWDIVSEERFDQNPKYSVKDSKVALKRYFAILKKKTE